jgi:hypothetical protein
MEKRTASVMSNAMATSMREERFSVVSEIAPMTAQQILRNSSANVANGDTVYDAQYKGVFLSAPA